MTMVCLTKKECELTVDEQTILSRSLGLPILKDLDKTLNAAVSQEYIEKILEMARKTPEAVYKFGLDRDQGLNGIIGEENLQLMKKVRRRSASRFQSGMSHRRSSSQAMRRNKLNTQGLMNHMAHIRKTPAEPITIQP